MSAKPLRVHASVFVQSDAWFSASSARVVSGNYVYVRVGTEYSSDLTLHFDSLEAIEGMASVMELAKKEFLAAEEPPIDQAE